MDADVINSMADTIHLLIDNIETASENDQVRILIQIIPFFKELLVCLNTKNIEKNAKVIKTLNECIKSYKQYIGPILNSDISFEELSTFINDIINSCITSKCITAISQLIVSIISFQNVSNETRNYFKKSIQSFFENQELRFEFVKGEGFLTILFSFISDQENILPHIVFDQFFDYLDYYKQTNFFSNIDAFYSAIFTHFSEFKEENIQIILQFLIKSLQKSPNYVLKHLNKSSTIISDYVLNHQSDNLYQGFYDFLKANTSLSKNPMYSILTKISSSKDCTKSLRLRVLMDILQIISNEKRQVFTNSDLSKVLSSIPVTDIESLLVAYSICLYGQIDSQKVMQTSILAFMENLKYEYFTQFDMNNLFTLFLNYPDQLSNYVELIYKPIFENDLIDSFTYLANRYKSMFSMILKHFQTEINDETKEKIVKSLVLSFHFYENNTPKSTLYTILVQKDGHQFVRTIFESIDKLLQSQCDVIELFDLLAQANYESEQLRFSCFESQIASIVISFYTKYKFDSTVILDYICSITSHRYVPRFDIQISELLRNNNFLDKNEDELLQFALGLKQNQKDLKGGNLCFPSILGFCKDHRFTDLFDLWICGESAINLWLTDTQRSINEFPSIVDIACFHIRLAHLKMIFDYPSLLYTIAQKLESIPPRWIFKENTKAKYPLNIPQTQTLKTICFWISPTENDVSEPTDLFSIGNAKLTFVKNEILLDNRVVWTGFKPNSWTFCTVVFTDLVSISFNLSRNISFKTTDLSLIFGYAQNLKVTWSIGGPIRIFNDILPNEKLVNIMNNGPCCSKTYGEVKYIVPMPIPLADFQYEVQPITIYSIGNYIKNVYGNLEFLFKRIFNLLNQNQIEDAKYHLRTLICLAKKKIVTETTETYSHYFSILFNLSPEIIDNQILSELLPLYENDTFDWDGFLPLLFDYNFHCSPLSVSLISTVFNLIAKYPINNVQLQTSLILFFASLLSIKEYKQELKLSILELIEYLKPDQNLCSNLIVSYPHLTDDLKKYTICPNDLILSELISMYGRLQFTKFTQYHLLSVLPKKESIEFQTILLKSKIENLDLVHLVDNCFRCINYKESWTNFLYITTKKWQEFDSISLNGFDMNFIENLIQMLSVLVCSCFYATIDQFWIDLALKLINEMNQIVSSIPDKFFKQSTFRFWIWQLMNFDLHSNFQSDEQTFDLNDIDLNIKPDELSKLQKNAFSICPKEVYFENNCVYQIDSTEIPSSIYLANQIKIGKNWSEYMKKKCQSFQQTEQQSELINPTDSPLFSSLCQLIARFLITSDNLYEVILSNLQFNSECYKEILSNALSLSMEMSSFQPEFIDFACDFIIRSRSYELLKKVFDTLSFFNEIPSSKVYIAIINLISLDDEIVPIIIEYKNLLLKSNFTQYSNVPSLIIGQCLHLLSHNKVDESLFQFFKSFMDIIPIAEIFSEDDSQLFEKFLAVNSVESYNTFVNENPDFNSILKRFTEFVNDYNVRLTEDLDSKLQLNERNQINYLTEISKTFMINQSLKKTINRTTAAIVETIFQQIFVLRTLFFLRQKEFFVSKVFKLRFNHAKVKNKCESFLSDPVYPTRRLITSPLDYNIPEFPQGQINDILKTTIGDQQSPNPSCFPQSISNIFTIDTNKTKFLEAYSEHQIHLRYVQSSTVPSVQKLNLIQMIYNQGKPFSFSASCSILYGSDTLNGSVFLDDDKFTFIEGLNCLNKNEMEFSSNDNFDNQCFYSFIILSGQLGSPSLFEGHPAISWDYDELLSFSQHNWLHKPYSFAMNFLRGFNFVLNLNHQKDFRAIETILNKKWSIFAVSSSISQKVLSPIQSAKYVTCQPKELSSLWLQGEISNFTYLLLLNRLGKRLTCDMTQYPVFPWLLSCFKQDTEDFNEILNDKSNFRDFSLPIGQINPERTGKFDETFKMSRGEYYYGSHYMHFAVVLFYLYRIDPFSFHFFIFNKGWDHPSRMFFNVSKAWATSLESPLDLKEIVPQFFCLPEMFEKSDSLFPEKADNEIVLPRWAKNPRDFTNKMLKLLESDHISAKIHMWIDLIFGEKSRGSAAIQAKNLFPPHCYIDTKNEVDVDEVEREALKLKIINFGQCPTQLFTRPHLSIYKSLPSNTVLSSKSWQHLRTDSFSMPPYILFVEGNLAISLNHPIFKSYILMNGMIFHIKNNNKIIVSRGNSISEFELGFDDVIDVKYSSSTISVSPDGALLCISRAEGIFALYRVFYSKSGDVKSISLIHQFETKGGIGMIAISSFHHIAFASIGKTIVQFDLGVLEELEEKISLSFSATKIYIDDIAALVYFIGDNNIAVCSISGKLLINQLTPMINESKRKQITCFAFPRLPEHAQSRFFVIGYEDGSIDFYKTAFDTDDSGQFIIVRTENFFGQPIVSIALSSNAQRMLVGTKTDIYHLETPESSYPPFKKELYAVTCAKCKSDIRKSANICSKCGLFFCQKCVKWDISTIKPVYVCSKCTNNLELF